MFEKWRKDFHKSEYKKGQEAVGQEMDAERFEEEKALLERTADVAAETIDRVDKLAADGNPHKQRLADLIKDRILAAAEHVTTGTGRHQVGEARGAVEADPFSASLPSTSTSLPSSEMSLPSSSTKALTHEPTEPPKKKRGRPPKERTN